ncbi:hypothetical protein D0Y65_034387 [Glycine soja]|uniref:Tf2-1-like SH3-like domain-containing protein n=1 Tax=Glycine soja TaxID=3848 RepID=A0A445HQL3_GLYSO|nr:hypothetical protein D0Y65_034387 [Glycine soja]
MAPFEALYGRKCRTPICWYDDGEAVLLGPEMLQQITEQVKLIREKIKASQDRQKSYYDRRRKPLDFQEEEHVFLKKVGPVAYQIALPPSLSNLHPVFYVSQLRRYHLDPSNVLAVDEVQVKDNLTYKAQPQKITDRRMKSLRGKEIALVKVQWGPDEGDSTWELEDRKLFSLILTLLFLPFSSTIEASIKAPNFAHHFYSKSQKEAIFGVVKRTSTLWDFKFQLGGIDGDPVLRGTRIRATWEYVSSVEGGQLRIVDSCVICGCGELIYTIARSPPSTTYDGLRNGNGILRWPLIMMTTQLIHDRVEMECLEGVWETLEGNARCRFRGTIRLTTTSLVHPEEPARTLQRTVEWILPTPTPYRLVEPVQVIEVSSSEEDPEEDLEELPPEPAVDALDFPEGDEDPLPDVDSPEGVMSTSEADSTEESGPGGIATSGDSSS